MRSNSLWAGALWALASSTSVHGFMRTARDFRDILMPRQFGVDPGIDQNAYNYYLGYRGDDYKKPWSKYFNDSNVPLNDGFQEGLAKSPVPANLGIPFANGGKELNKPGYLPLENGYTIMNDGVMMLAIRSDVPSNFTGEQYDWWFSWHINDTTKYKLWNPSAHQYAAINRADLGQKANVSTSNYRQRYYDLTSFVDEFIGPQQYKISIGFFDPKLLNFTPDNPSTGVETIVTAFVRIFAYADQNPNDQARAGFGLFDVVLAHQVRAKPDGTGKEIRSRFWFGSGLVAAMRFIMDPLTLGRDLSVHCAVEMTHLGTFLPAIFNEYKNDRPVVA